METSKSKDDEFALISKSKDDEFTLISKEGVKMNVNIEYISQIEFFQPFLSRNLKLFESEERKILFPNTSEFILKFFISLIRDQPGMHSKIQSSITNDFLNLHLSDIIHFLNFICADNVFIKLIDTIEVAVLSLNVDLDFILNSKIHSPEKKWNDYIINGFLSLFGRSEIPEYRKHHDGSISMRTLYHIMISRLNFNVYNKLMLYKFYIKKWIVSDLMKFLNREEIAMSFKRRYVMLFLYMIENEEDNRFDSVIKDGKILIKYVDDNFKLKFHIYQESILYWMDNLPSSIDEDNMERHRKLIKPRCSDSIIVLNLDQKYDENSKEIISLKEQHQNAILDKRQLQFVITSKLLKLKIDRNMIREGYNYEILNHNVSQFNAGPTETKYRYTNSQRYPTYLKLSNTQSENLKNIANLLNLNSHFDEIEKIPIASIHEFKLVAMLSCELAIDLDVAYSRFIGDRILEYNDFHFSVYTDRHTITYLICRSSLILKNLPEM